MTNLEKRYLDSQVVISLPLLRASVEEAQELQNVIKQEMELGNDKFIIDLNSCEYLDSSFVGAMVLMFKKLKVRNGNISLVKSGNFSDMIFLITQTLTIFQIFDSIEEAVSHKIESEEEFEIAFNSYDEIYIN